MSAEGAASQPPPAGGDKSRAPKPPTFSATINKSGKAFAPKKGVIRRRPGAGTAAPAPKPSDPPSSNAESQTQSQSETQAQRDTTPAAALPTIAQLPTPAATQEPVAQDVQSTEQTVSHASTAVTDPIAVVEASPTPATADERSVTQQRGALDSTIQSQTPETTVVQPAGNVLEPPRSPKRRRVESPKQIAKPLPETLTQRWEPLAPVESSAVASLPTESAQPAPERAISRSGDVEGTDIEGAGQPRLTTSEVQVDPSQSTVQETEITEPQTLESQGSTQPTKPKRRRLPWTAVNTPLEDAEEPIGNTRTRQTKGKRKRGPITLRQLDEEEEQELVEEPAPTAPKRLSAKAKGKRKVGEVDEEAGSAQRPAKKPRQPRRAKEKSKAVDSVDANGAEGEAVVGEDERPKRKSRKKKASNEPVDNAVGDGSRQPKRKGRPAREATPSDAEDEIIDPGTTFMDSLASRNIRVGRLSQREKKMRTINWTEVKERRREQEAMHYDRHAAQAEVTRQLNEAAAQAAALQQSSGPRFETIDGQIRLVHSSNTIDRHAQAEAEIDQMQTVDEDDLTNRITYRSFMRNNKRHPEEFMIPGQGKRWNWKDTNDFYDALRMFGTDFMMISTLFPNVTRRSVKLKFTREERQNPQKIKDALHASEISDWDMYLAKSGRKDDSFVDHNEVKRQLAEEWDAMQVTIEAAKAAAEEEKRQRQLAGVESEEETGDKENGKGRKKKEGKKAAKQVTFDTPEEGVEIIGNIDEDENWGQE